ncbi:MAG: BadF/BadG/BcrA/BcrD ATPase family protein [Ignavibacteriota bacterium]
MNPDRKIAIGFDGGGSTSRFLVSRGNGEKESYTYPLNLKYSDLGIEESVRGFTKCLNEILGSDLSHLIAMCISLSGASDAALNQEFVKALRSELKLPELKLHVEGDSSFALETAYPGDASGMLLIAGTGSVAIAKTEEGDIVKVGGWGRLLGDEGSGYWIGLEVLRSYCSSIDLDETTGEFFLKTRKKLVELIGTDLSLLRSKLYSNQIKPQDFAPLAFECAEQDEDANDIVLLAADLLATDVNVLWDKVEGECEPILMLHGTIASQPAIFKNIQEACYEFGVDCELLDGNLILERTLRVAEDLKC